jgi:hypothetical protein
MNKVRVIGWALAIGATAVAAAALLFRMIPGSGVVFLVLLVLCVAFFSALAGLLVEVPKSVGIAAGAFAAALVAVVLGVTISVAPLQPGAKRPGLADLLWLPLLALLAALAICALAGWFGARTGLRFAHRHGRQRPG